MKKRLVRLVAAVLALAVIFPPAHAAQTNSQGSVTVRVGLASSDSGSNTRALIGANLWNVENIGAGFRFGYFDAKMDFVELARTDKSMTQISVIKAQNTWFQGKNRGSYSNTDNGGSVVGTYSLQLPGSYSSYQEARTAADKAADGFVAWINGDYQVRAGSYTTREKAEAAAKTVSGATVVSTSKYGMNVIRNGYPEILFQYDGGQGSKLAVMPDVTGAPDAQCWFYDLKYRGAFTYERIGGGELTVVNVLSLEDYIKGVVPYEMSPSWPLEALKAQALCARTYTLTQMNRHESNGFDVCPSGHCQAYYGVGDDDRRGATAVTDRAVDETAGKVLWYKNRLAQTFYASSHGGASEDAKNVWGTNTSENGYPYLCGVSDPYEKYTDDINPRAHWTEHYTSAELTEQLHKKGYGGSAALDHLVLTYSDLGNVIEAELHWDNGQKNTLNLGKRVKSAFSLYSIRFTVNGKTAGQNGGGKPAEDVYLNGSQKLETLNGMYVISDDGSIQPVGSSLHVITGDKNILPIEQQSAGGSGNNKVEIKSDNYVFEGSGWGHQLGMSQYGAYGMAKQGFGCEKIVTFYFPGTHVGPLSF